MPRTEPISENPPSENKARSDTQQLAQERAAREAAERHALALMAEKRVLEHKVINAQRTLAYGLGRALIEARSIKGMLALPGRIRKLRLKQKAKRRERVPNSFVENTANDLRLIDPTLEIARTDGIDAAREWVHAQSGSLAAQARALAELAHWTLETDAALAGQIGLAAAALYPQDSRLFALAFGLHEAGLVRQPGALCAAFAGHQPLSQPQRRWCDRMCADAAVLDSGIWEASPAARERHGGSGRSLAILCPRRLKDSPLISSCRQQASAAGFSVSTVDLSADIDLSEYAVVHIVADRLHVACETADKARHAGCRLIVDLGHPPRALQNDPESERASVEAIRLRGLAAAVDIFVTRSASMARQLDLLDIRYTLAESGSPPSADRAPDHNLSEEAVAAALTEYGARTDLTTIICIGTLDSDPGMIAFLDAFDEIASVEKDCQLLILGYGLDRVDAGRRLSSSDIGNRVHFVGRPPPQRWPALLAGADLVISPRLQGEVLGSEAPLLLLQALALGRPVLATQASWDGQVAWETNSASIVRADTEWQAAIRASLTRSASSQSKPRRVALSSEDIYSMINKVL